MKTRRSVKKSPRRRTTPQLTGRISAPCCPGPAFKGPPTPGDYCLFNSIVVVAVVAIIACILCMFVYLPWASQGKQPRVAIVTQKTYHAEFYLYCGFADKRNDIKEVNGHGDRVIYPVVPDKCEAQNANHTLELYYRFLDDGSMGHCPISEKTWNSVLEEQNVVITEFLDTTIAQGCKKIEPLQ